MKKKNIAIIVIIAIILIAGGLLIKQAYFPSNSVAVEKLMQVNSDREMSEFQLGVFDELKAELMQDPNNYSSLFELASLKQGLNDVDGALSLYKELREKKPEDILVLNNMASIYYNKQDYEKAEALHLEILEISPTWMSSYDELYTIYQFHLKDKRDSYEGLIKKGVELSPYNNGNLYAKAASFFDEVVQDDAKSLEYYEKLLEIDPENANAKKRIPELKK